ncbi:hypothetical protein PHPALM_31049 [Phytophthora palmivora]|uniref:Uncharacterized protein n=1 Tax=Phytophthora palmivora TaxID=4796 RepID=A0A2P4X3K6_9STRA|nr:hypothetical protein PHPALM_31049 [Phytophthora palmivora]
MCKNATLLGYCTTMSEDVTPDERARHGTKKSTGHHKQSLAKENIPSTITCEEFVAGDTLEILEDILGTAKSAAPSCNTEDATEYYMLPPRDPAQPGSIEGSVRIFARTVAGAQEFIAEFFIGYLTSVPTLLQQEELHYFFQIPPHNPLTLKCDGSQVYLENCIVHQDDTSGRGFRLVMEMPLGTYSLPAIAELLDYLLSTTNLYLSTTSS